VAWDNRERSSPYRGASRKKEANTGLVCLIYKKPKKNRDPLGYGLCKKPCRLYERIEREGVEIKARVAVKPGGSGPIFRKGDTP